MTLQMLHDVCNGQVYIDSWNQTLFEGNLWDAPKKLLDREIKDIQIETGFDVDNYDREVGVLWITLEDQTKENKYG